jgi:hypothetical protein
MLPPRGKFGILSVFFLEFLRCDLDIVADPRKPGF